MTAVPSSGFYCLWDNNGMSVITKLADAIQRVEGYKPGTRAWKNNNPGNIWDGLAAGKKRRIWPSIPIDDKGFLIYPTPAAGRSALEFDLQQKINRGMTLITLINMYAPPIENDTLRYIKLVAEWTGLPTDVPLNKLEKEDKMK